jgi:hypothetical protein
MGLRKTAESPVETTSSHKTHSSAHKGEMRASDSFFKEHKKQSLEIPMNHYSLLFK